MVVTIRIPPQPSVAEDCEWKMLMSDTLHQQFGKQRKEGRGIMVINAILLEDTDNVVTCVKEIQAGEEVKYRYGEEIRTLAAAEMIPYCHKIALKTLEKGDHVIKYGEMIGRASEKIEKGHWVSHLNIYSVPRDYESEYIV